MGQHAYRYRIDKPYSYYSPLLLGVNFNNDWVQISGGTIHIRERYAWDGCSPKFRVLGLFDIGVPDGALLYGLPITYYASLVHDAISQFRAEIPITKAQSVALFDDMLAERKFELRPLYVAMVEKFGPKRKDFLKR